MPPFSSEKGFRLFFSKYLCLSNLPQQKNFMKQHKGEEEMLLGGFLYESAIVDLFFVFIRVTV